MSHTEVLHYFRNIVKHFSSVIKFSHILFKQNVPKIHRSNRVYPVRQSHWRQIIQSLASATGSSNESAIGVPIGCASCCCIICIKVHISHDLNSNITKLWSCNAILAKVVSELCPHITHLKICTFDIPQIHTNPYKSHKWCQSGNENEKNEWKWIKIKANWFFPNFQICCVEVMLDFSQNPSSKPAERAAVDPRRLQGQRRQPVEAQCQLDCLSFEKNKTRFKSQKTRLKRDFEFETDRNCNLSMRWCAVPQRSQVTIEVYQMKPLRDASAMKAWQVQWLLWVWIIQNFKTEIFKTFHVNEINQNVSCLTFTTRFWDVSSANILSSNQIFCAMPLRQMQHWQWQHSGHNLKSVNCGNQPGLQL